MSLGEAINNHKIILNNSTFKKGYLIYFANLYHVAFIIN